jgi:hypothetical protein
MKTAYISGILIAVSALLFLTPVRAQSNDPEFIQALSWMYNIGMTKYTTTDLFQPNDWLLREQAAKFFVGFQNEKWGGIDTTTQGCTFSDLASADATLQESIVTSCQMHLFMGTAGKFQPTAPLTKAQALTVLVRSLDGTTLDETGNPWWGGYHTRARALGLTKEVDVWSLDRPITRYEMALLLYRAANGGINYEQQELDELKQILLQLGIRLQ